MPVSIHPEGEITIITPVRAGDPNPDRVIILVREEIRKLIADSVWKVIVDCSSLDFLSSTEVGAMIGAIREINQVQGAVVFTGIGARLAEIFEVMRIIEILPIRFTTREAQLELGRLRKEPNLIGRLSQSNPTLAQIYAWADGQLKVAKAQTPAPFTEKDKADAEGVCAPRAVTIRPEDEETLFGRKAVPVSAGIGAPDPWNTALSIVRQAQTLCYDQGVDFQPTMSFQEFLGQLSMKLPAKS